jgi:hypothetical protein
MFFFYRFLNGKSSQCWNCVVYSYKNALNISWKHLIIFEMNIMSIGYLEMFFLNNVTSVFII